MANIAESAVLVSSAEANEAVARLTHVGGPESGFDSAQHIIESYPRMGFQATHYGLACSIARRMIQRQLPSRVYQMKDGKYVLAPRNIGEDGKAEGREKVYPSLFLGVTANLMGTGCRDAIRFLVQEGVVRRSTDASADGTDDQLMFNRLKEEYTETYGVPPHADEEELRFHSFLCSIVLSGGGVEHDLRRACATYTVHQYASEAPDRASVPAATQAVVSAVRPARFGNVWYPRQGSAGSELFDSLMNIFVRRLCTRQARLREAAEAKPIPDKYNDVCSWSVTPSEVWALCGLWLVDMLAEALRALQNTTSRVTNNISAPVTEPVKLNSKCEGGESGVDVDAEALYRAEALSRARTTVVYWAALQQVPLYSPSFVDGDIAGYLLPLPTPSEVKGTRNTSLSPTTQVVDETPVVEKLKLDLVRDVHSINKLAMLSKKTGMLICGGGVVKHHVCNANLMRNGADFTIIINNGQEFDGSDAGAKPEEALSWGKVRMEGEFVKVYGEVSTYLPLLVAEVFVPVVRQRRATEDALLRRKNFARGRRHRKMLQRTPTHVLEKDI